MTSGSSDKQTGGKTVVAPNIGIVSHQAINSIGPRWAVIGIFLILLGGALYLTASFTLPVVVALVFAMVLSPIVRVAKRRLRIWEPVSAAVLVVGTLVVLTASFYMLSGPVSEIASNAPVYARAVDEQLSGLRNRFARLERAQADVEPDAPADADDPQEVVVRSPSLLDNAATSAPQLLASVAFALIFLFFLLSSGDLFHSKLVKSMPTFSDKKLALGIAHEIEQQLSRYLFTITTINLGLGVAVGSVLWWAGMPTPAVFGALAFLLNYIPYIGAIVGLAIVGVIALAEFGSLAQALVPVVLYFACTSIEGQLITPMVVGRRLEMNAAAVFLSVAFWGWIWGVVGMFLAVPIMVGIKILSSYVEGLEPLGNFMSVDKAVNADDDSD